LLNLEDINMELSILFTKGKVQTAGSNHLSDGMHSQKQEMLCNQREHLSYGI